MSFISPFRVKPLVFAVVTSFIIVGLGFLSLNGWRLVNIGNNLDIATYYASCDGLPTEEDLVYCVQLLNLDYLNDPHWLALTFVYLLLAAALIGYIAAAWAGRERVIVVPLAALLASLALWLRMQHAELAALACFAGLLLGGLFAHSRAKRGRGKS